MVEFIQESESMIATLVAIVIVALLIAIGTLAAICWALS
jgi:hypothetical protein